VRGLLLSAGSILLCALLLELGARALLLFQGPIGPGSTFAEYGQYDPLLGWSKKPLAHTLFRRYEYQTDISINSHGLRDQERPYEKSPDAFRILALGDSYVEGFAVAYDKTVGQVLEHSLGARACPVEVLNGGTTGYSTDQEYLFYHSEGERYSPDVVLLFFYYNDVLPNAMQKVLGGIPKPIFVFDGDGLRLYRTPVPRATRAPFSYDYDWVGSRSAFLAWVKQRLWFGAPTLYNRLGATLHLWKANRPIGAALELRVYSTETIPKLENAWERTRRLLVKLSREARDNGSRFAVVYVPNNMELDEDAWRYGMLRYQINEASWDRRLVLRRLQGITGQASIPLLDLTTALRAVDLGPQKRPYFQEDGHWNAAGHAAAGRAVQGFLETAGWLPARCGAGGATRPTGP
jgi:lysophospholipase L1-like esterase